MVIIIDHKLTLSSYTDPLVNRLGMWCCLLKPYFRYGWSSNVFRRSLHILLGNGDSPPNGVFAWHPKRPAILQDTIIFHTDSEYCNQFISGNSWMWYSYKAVSKMPKDCENGSVFVGSLWKVLRRKAASFLYFRYKSFHKKGFVLLTFGTRSGILYHWSGKGTFSTI